MQLWDPWNCKITSIAKFAKQTTDGTEITLPLSNKEIQLIVFTPEEYVQKADVKEMDLPECTKQTTIDKNWEFELKPSLDNQWGDFQLPASNEMMGADVRQVYLQENKEYKGEKLTIDKTWKYITCGYGPHFLKLGPLEKLPDKADLVKMVPKNTFDSIMVGNKKYCWEEYSFSWKLGVEGDYGHQGYHGLKGQMYDNFIRLGALGEDKHSMKRIPEPAGNFNILYSSVLAKTDGTFELLSATEKPTFLLINSSFTDVNSITVHLRKGRNTILAVYSRACETYLVFREADIERPAKQQVSMCWYGDYGVLPFDCSPATQVRSGLYTFESAPGLQSFTFAAYGNIKLWIDGMTIKPLVVQKYSDGLTAYSATVKDIKKSSSQVVLKIDYQPGYTCGAAVPQFFKQQCGKASIDLGDWSKIDGLKAYSGGAWYRKNINLNSNDLKGKLEIDLGDLVSSSELFVNGKSAGIKLSPPWRFDITELAKAGDNKIEILIYNTLSNNYTTIPTRYRGEIKSGLIGPVKILSYR